MALQSIPEVVDDLREGKMVVLVDDEERENEGDLILAAEKATPEALNFMLTHARGFICLPLDDGVADKLALPPMVTPNQCPLGTPFTVTIDAAQGITTGVSVFDRCATISRVVADDARPEDFVRPGHIFPLRAHPGGLRKRAGHTEGAVELTRLSGLKPVAVIAEIMNPDGTMAKLPELQAFAGRHDLRMCSIEELLRFLDSGQNIRY